MPYIDLYLTEAEALLFTLEFWELEIIEFQKGNISHFLQRHILTYDVCMCIICVLSKLKIHNNLYEKFYI